MPMPTAPQFIRIAATLGGLSGLLANALMYHESLLRLMCFLDNEYGPRAGYDVTLFSQRIVTNINQKYADNGRRIRVLNVAPLQLRHHHVAVDFGEVLPEVGLTDTKRLVYNLYPLSKRKIEEDGGTSNDPIANSSNPRGQRVSAPSRGAGRRGAKMTMKEFQTACAAELGG